jgi:hypothetical protein
MKRLLGLAAAALLLTGCAAPSALSVPGGGEARASVSAPAPSPSSSSTTTPALTSSAAPVPDVPVRDAAPAPPRPLPPAPARLDYPAIAADMGITPVGVSADGQMAIPEDAVLAGWYRHSASPAETDGTVVIAAHAGSIPTPRGPLYDLRDSRPGHEVVLEDTDGHRTAYRVSRVDQLTKTTIDFRAYFTRAGEKRLVLITCGGRWDERRQSYDDNIIVTAVPLG